MLLAGERMKRLRNVAVLVRDLEAALAAWDRSSGLRGERTESSEAQRASLQVAGVSIDLLSPTGDGALARALEARGEGLYWLIIETDVLVEAVAELREKGVAVSDIVAGPDGRRGALIDAASAQGVPIRLVESPGEGET
jgi:hypothetical protein